MPGTALAVAIPLGYPVLGVAGDLPPGLVGLELTLLGSPTHKVPP